MNQTVETVVLDPVRAQNLRAVGIVSYVLHTIVALGALLPGMQVSVLLLLVAVLIDLIKRGDAQGSWQASHFRWRLRSVLFAGLAYALTAPLWLLFLLPGWIAWCLISIWFLYRIVRGMVTMNQSRAIDA